MHSRVEPDDTSKRASAEASELQRKHQIAAIAELQPVVGAVDAAVRAGPSCVVYVEGEARLARRDPKRAAGVGWPAGQRSCGLICGVALASQEAASSGRREVLGALALTSAAALLGAPAPAKAFLGIGEDGNLQQSYSDRTVSGGETAARAPATAKHAAASGLDRFVRAIAELPHA